MKPKYNRSISDKNVHRKHCQSEIRIKDQNISKGQSIIRRSWRKWPPRPTYESHVLSISMVVAIGLLFNGHLITPLDLIHRLRQIWPHVPPFQNVFLDQVKIPTRIFESKIQSAPSGCSDQSLQWAPNFLITVPSADAAKSRSDLIHPPSPWYEYHLIHLINDHLGSSWSLIDFGPN